MYRSCWMLTSAMAAFLFFSYLATSANQPAKNSAQEEKTTRPRHFDMPSVEPACASGECSCCTALSPSDDEQCQCGCGMSLKDCDANVCEYKQSIENGEAKEDEMEAIPTRLELPTYQYKNTLGKFTLDGDKGTYRTKDGSEWKLDFQEMTKSKNKELKYFVYKIKNKNVRYAFSAEPFKSKNGSKRYYLYRKEGDGAWKRILTHGGTSRSKLSDD